MFLQIQNLQATSFHLIPNSNLTNEENQKFFDAEKTAFFDRVLFSRQTPEEKHAKVRFEG